MLTVLWISAIYLLIGTIVYFISLGIIDEEGKTLSEYNNVMLLSIVFLWLPILLISVFSPR